MLRDLQTVFRQSTTPISHYIFEYSPRGIHGAYVHPTEYIFKNNRSTDAWLMSIDAGIAYPNLMKGDNTYNADGLFGYFLFHEWGHIETLNRDTQLNNGVAIEDCSSYMAQDGCMNTGSIFWAFINTFYTMNRSGDPHTARSKADINTPQFVNEYSQTDASEDIAESFAYAITQEVIPTTTTSSSGAIQKINLLKNYPDFAGYRDLRNHVNTQLSDENDLHTYYNKFPLRGRKSCLERYRNVLRHHVAKNQKTGD